MTVFALLGISIWWDAAVYQWWWVEKIVVIVDRHLRPFSAWIITSSPSVTITNANKHVHVDNKLWVSSNKVTMTTVQQQNGTTTTNRGSKYLRNFGKGAVNDWWLLFHCCYSFFCPFNRHIDLVHELLHRVHVEVRVHVWLSFIV